MDDTGELVGRPFEFGAAVGTIVVVASQCTARGDQKIGEVAKQGVSS